jgi:hypothetical protein
LAARTDDSTARPEAAALPRGHGRPWRSRRRLREPPNHANGNADSICYVF